MSEAEKKELRKAILLFDKSRGQTGANYVTGKIRRTQADSQFEKDISTLISIYENLLNQHDQAIYDAVNRFEVIDDTGRAYVKGSIYGSPVKVELSLQDDDKTLKVFVKQRTALQELREGGVS